MNNQIGATQKHVDFSPAMKNRLGFQPRAKASYCLCEEHRREARMKVSPSPLEPHSGGWEGLRRKWIRIHLLS
jgi:hypothetical protein